MPIVHSTTSQPCPVNFGLDEATARVIVDPRASERTITYASQVLEKIGNPIFDDFVGKILRDPTIWTITSIEQTRFGRALTQHSRGQLKMTDVTCSHSLKNPKEILLTIELGPAQVSTYAFSRMNLLNENVKVIQNIFPVLVHLTNTILSGSRHCSSCFLENSNFRFQKFNKF